MIVAVSKNNVIGKNNSLAWHLPDDMNYFSNMTQGHSVIMGRKNWESIPKKFRPLPNRKNIVITRNTDFNEDKCEVVNSLKDAIKVSRSNDDEEIFIIGGGEIYNLFIDDVKELHRTLIDTKIENADTFITDISNLGFHMISERQVSAGEKDQFDMIFQHFIR